MWSFFQDKTVGIFGMGHEGQSAKRALQTYAPSARLIEINEENLCDLTACDCVIKSPGVSLYRPEIQAFIAAGKKVIGGTDLFFAHRLTKAPVIAITGTKGKSTTSALLAHTLTALGYQTVLGGNIGTPLLDVLDKPADFVVAELSSYQCADLTATPDVAVLTNLFPEHLQWHTSHEQYYRDKMHMIRLARHAFVNRANETVSKMCADMPVDSFLTPGSIHITDGLFYDGETPLFPTDVLPLAGEHNAQNACAVLSVLKYFNCDIHRAENAFKTFKALPHRLEVIPTSDGRVYVDDSISTTPETAVAALKAFDTGQFLTLLAGGFDRGQVYHVLIDFLKSRAHRCHIIALPDTGRRLMQLAQENGINCSFTNTVAEGVKMAQTHTPIGGLVLLSPAAPSYNCYHSFEERGCDFKKNVLLNQ